MRRGGIWRSSIVGIAMIRRRGSREYLPTHRMSSLVMVICKDADEMDRILFNGTWAGYVDMACKWNGTASSVGCYFGSGAGELVVKPLVKWQSLSSMQGLPYDFQYPYGGHPFWEE